MGQRLRKSSSSNSNSNSRSKSSRRSRSKSKSSRRNGSRVRSRSRSNSTADSGADSRLPGRRRNVQSHEIAVLPEDSRVLVLSSLFFCVPGLYAISSSLFSFAFLSFVTTAVSINYWRNATAGARRQADLLVAKVSFVLYFFSGLYFVRELRLFAVGIPILIAIVGCYMQSLALWERDSPTWKYFHAGFHLAVALEQGLVLYAAALAGAPRLPNF